MDIILLKVIILIIFCLIGFGVGGLIGNRVGNPKKINEVSEELIEYSMKILKESKEFKEGICPEPKEGDNK